MDLFNTYALSFPPSSNYYFCAVLNDKAPDHVHLDACIVLRCNYLLEVVDGVMFGFLKLFLV